MIVTAGVVSQNNARHRSLPQTLIAIRPGVTLRLPGFQFPAPAKGRSVSRTYTLINKTNRELHLISQVSCSCATITFRKPELIPHSSTSVIVTFDTGLVPGPGDYARSFSLINTRSPPARSMISAVGHFAVAVEPGLTVGGCTIAFTPHSSRQFSGLVHFGNATAWPMRVEIPHVRGRFFSLRSENLTIPAGRVRTARITIHPQMPDFPERFTLPITGTQRLGNAKVRRYTGMLTVYAQPEGDLAVSPGSIIFGPHAFVDGSLRRKFTFVLESDVRPHILTVKGRSPAVTVLSWSQKGFSVEVKRQQGHAAYLASAVTVTAVTRASPSGAHELLVRRCAGAGCVTLYAEGVCYNGG